MAERGKLAKAFVRGGLCFKGRKLAVPWGGGKNVLGDGVAGTAGRDGVVGKWQGEVPPLGGGAARPTAVTRGKGMSWWNDESSY